MISRVLAVFCELVKEIVTAVRECSKRSCIEGDDHEIIQAHCPKKVTFSMG